MPLFRRAGTALLFHIFFIPAVVLLCAPTEEADETPPPDPDRVFRLSLDSRAMGRKMPYVVKMPRKGFKRTRFPVVYLLHGWQGDEEQLLKVNNGLATKHQLVLVQPTMESLGGWFDSPLDPRRQYLRMLLDEVVPAVEARFPVARHRSGRGITGFSMGGQGALRAAIRRPDLFAVVGATSGIMDLAGHDGAYGMREMLGPPEDLDLYRRTSVLYGLSHLLPGIQARMPLDLFLECPDADRLARPSNLALARRLKQLRVRLRTDFDHPGGHSSDYYATRIDDHLAWIKSRFEKQAKEAARTSGTSNGGARR